MGFLDDLRKKLDDVGAHLNPFGGQQAAQQPMRPSAQVVLNAKMQANLNQNQPVVNGHVFNYATPDLNVGPAAPYTPLNRGISFGNPRANPNIPGVPLLNGTTNASNPSFSIYGNSQTGGQQWYENDNAGTPGGGPSMHIPIVKPGTPQLDTQGSVAPSKSGKFINALPQYINPVKKYPRIQI